MGNTEVVPVDSKRRLKSFVELPYELLGSYPHWVPPLRIAVRDLLNRQKHPFYQDAEAEFFLAVKGGRPVGRIAAILNRAHNRVHQDKVGFFGFFDSVNDADVARALLAEARRWTRERGADVLRGPMSPSTNYECGMLVEGFDSDPLLMMPYNPPYYPALMDACGLKKCKDLYAWSADVAGMPTSKIERVAQKALADTNVTVRPIDMKRFDADVDAVWKVYEAAWTRNWGYVPMSHAEFVLMGKDMKQILKPELVLIGEVRGEVVGFALALPDANQAMKPARGSLFPTGLLKILYYQRSIDATRVLALGVTEQYRTTGLPAAFYAILIRNARALGMRRCEMSWILEDNVLMNRSIQIMGGTLDKKYRIYDWN